MDLENVNYKISAKCRDPLILKLVESEIFAKDILNKFNVLYGFIAGSRALGYIDEKSDYDIVLISKVDIPPRDIEFSINDVHVHTIIMSWKNFVYPTNTSNSLGGFLINYTITEKDIFYINEEAENFEGINILLRDILYSQSLLKDMENLTVLYFYKLKDYINDGPKYGLKRWYKLLNILQKNKICKLSKAEILSYKRNIYSILDFNTIVEMIEKYLSLNNLSLEDIEFLTNKINTIIYNTLNDPHSLKILEKFKNTKFFKEKISNLPISHMMIGGSRLFSVQNLTSDVDILIFIDEIDPTIQNNIFEIPYRRYLIDFLDVHIYIIPPSKVVSFNKLAHIKYTGDNNLYNDIETYEFNNKWAYYLYYLDCINNNNKYDCNKAFFYKKGGLIWKTF